MSSRVAETAQEKPAHHRKQGGATEGAKGTQEGPQCPKGAQRGVVNLRKKKKPGGRYKLAKKQQGGRSTQGPRGPGGNEKKRRPSHYGTKGRGKGRITYERGKEKSKGIKGPFSRLMARKEKGRMFSSRKAALSFLAVLKRAGKGGRGGHRGKIYRGGRLSDRGLNSQQRKGR